MRAGFYIVAPFLILGLIYAQTGEQGPYHKTSDDAIRHNQPTITVTINPEARASVALVGSLPAPVLCRAAANLQVRIVNQGFVTSRLEAKLVGEVRDNVILDFEPSPLKGIPEEIRNLHITLIKPNQMDLTIAFKLHNETPDLGGRDRIHFLMHCIQAK